RVVACAIAGEQLVHEFMDGYDAGPAVHDRCRITILNLNGESGRLRLPRLQSVRGCGNELYSAQGLRGHGGGDPRTGSPQSVDAATQIREGANRIQETMRRLVDRDGHNQRLDVEIVHFRDDDRREQSNRRPMIHGLQGDRAGDDWRIVRGDDGHRCRVINDGRWHVTVQHADGETRDFSARYWDTVV